MGIEIERKFLVKDDSFKTMCKSSYRIKQGYICSERGRTIRVRIRDNEGFLTIKGASSDNGLSRYEWEYKIPLEEAEGLMKLCLPGIIDKTRYLVEYGNHVLEVDEFYGDNDGLVVAEIELKRVDEQFSLPDFVGDEVTGDVKYYNSFLMKSPYKTWK